MTNNLDVSQFGSIIPSTIMNIKWDVNYKDVKNIVYAVSEKITLKGKIRKSGIANENERVYGIETKKYFPFCIQNSSKCAERLKLDKEFMVVVKDTIDFVEIDQKTGMVLNEKIDDESEQKYKKDDLVIVHFKEEYKVAKIMKSGTINAIVCHEIELADKLIRKRIYTVIDDDVDGNLLNEKEFVCNNEHLVLKADNGITNQKIGSEFYYKGRERKLRWKGLVNGLECVGMDGDPQEIFDFNTFTNSDDSYWIIIPFVQNTLDSSCAVKESEYPVTNNQNLTRTKMDDSKNTVSSSKVPYKMALSTIKPPTIKVVQLDDDACYLYTIVNSMFIFTEMFDSLIACQKNKICEHLTSTIVMPIRSGVEISPDEYSNFAKMLIAEQADDNNDHLFARLLHDIGFNFKMSHYIDGNIENERFIDLSSTIKDQKSSKIKLLDLLNCYCLTEKMFISEPPKCLIMGFPNRNSIKNSIAMPPKLDITKITVSCTNCCSVCSSEAKRICRNCSTEKCDIIYFCDDHMMHCKHDKQRKQISESKFKNLNGKVELDLMAFVCKQESKFYAYVKTNDVKGSWIKFSKINCDMDICGVDLLSYFKNSDWNKAVINKDDAETVEKHMCVCLYKYSPLEFYWNGF